MRQIFSAESKIVAERELWLAVARAQKKLGHPITDEQLSAYEKVKHAVHLDSIDEREKVTRHDVKARIEEFNAIAGHEVIHTGMTSRDLTEARDAAYRTISQIKLEGSFYRNDIALNASIAEKGN